LWKKFCRDISSAVQLLARSPVGHKLAPYLERAFLAVGCLQRQQIGPIRSFNAGALYRPSQVA
jgi:hypothetical protein